jgi:amidase
VTLPVHNSPEGLPIGVQLMARIGCDELLIGLAAALEETFGWPDRHPPQWWR